mmetsp:Transcript_52348/g.122814  ORF Transcript_52348/g.122814 Transcript_52348/m.122814 type:complete len:161 (+) Transcript_52348:261-743(+)
MGNEATKLGDLLSVPSCCEDVCSKDSSKTHLVQSPAKQTNSDNRQPLAGVGAVLGIDKKTRKIIVTSFSPGSAAGEAFAKGDLQCGDFLHSINRSMVNEKMTMYDVAALLLGPSGSEVNFAVRRGDEIHELRLERRMANPSSPQSIVDRSDLVDGATALI